MECKITMNGKQIRIWKEALKNSGVLSRHFVVEEEEEEEYDKHLGQHKIRTLYRYAKLFGQTLPASCTST
jgi:hypothetical protein